MGKTTFAHQIDLSTIIFSKTENGKIVMQITSSLTAFQQEVNYNNPKNSYKTPEEFRNLVIKHFSENFSIIINKKDTLKFINPIVILGHETKIVTEVIGIPSNVNIIQLQNEVFKDIYNNESVVMFALKGFPENRNFILGNENNSKLNITLEDGTWQPISENEMSTNLKYSLSVFIIILIGLLFYLIRKNKNKEKVKAV